MLEKVGDHCRGLGRCLVRKAEEACQREKIVLVFPPVVHPLHKIYDRSRSNAIRPGLATRPIAFFQHPPPHALTNSSHRISLQYQIAAVLGFAVKTLSASSPCTRPLFNMFSLLGRVNCLSFIYNTTFWFRTYVGIAIFQSKTIEIQRCTLRKNNEDNN